MKINRLCALIVATLSVSNSALGNDKSEIEWRLSQGGLKESLSLISQDKSYSEMVQLLLSSNFDVKKDSVKESYTIVNYFPRFVDIESYGTMGLYFDPNYQKVIIKAAASVSPDGKVKQINPSHVQVLNTGGYNTFSSHKEVSLAIPGLEEGSIAVLKYDIVSQRDLMEPDWAEELFTQQNYPIERYELNVEWSSDSPIHWQENSREVECSQSTGQLHCSGQDIPSYIGDYQVLWRDGVDSIAIGSLGTWQSVADKANFTMRKAFDDTTGLDALYLQLTKGATSTSEKIERILSFVSRDIRYVSRSEYGHAMTPHDIAETIENRFGDCKDKSVLLIGLLEKIGLSPELVLVSTKRTDPSRVLVPSMNAFNHVVVCFDHGGEHYCVDPTDTQTNWKYTSSWIQNKVALPLSKSASLGTIQKSPYRWKMAAETEILFDELGGQKEVQERTYTGEFAAVLRSNLYELSEKERLEKLTDQYADVVSSIGKPEFELENLDSMTSKAVIRSTSVIDPFLVVGEGLNYEEVDAWIENELDELKMSNEIYPALFQGVDIVSKFHYDTNGLWKITHVPATLELRHPLGVLKRQVKLISPTELSVTTELQVKSRWVIADERKRFNKMLDVFAEQSLIKFYGKAL
ncbi:DUF3857 domain-containing transglutaminase family protein [Vibrio campbellii]